MPGYTRRHLRRDIIKEMILRECACQDQEEMRADHGVKFHNNGPEEESGMIRSNLYTLSKQAQEMHDMIGMNDDLDEWVQEKIAVATAMIDTIYDYIHAETARAGMSEAKKPWYMKKRRNLKKTNEAEWYDIPKTKSRSLKKKR